MNQLLLDGRAAIITGRVAGSGQRRPKRLLRRVQPLPWPRGMRLRCRRLQTNVFNLHLKDLTTDVQFI